MLNGKLKKMFQMLLLMLLMCSFVFAQSKTEKAKDRLDKGKKESKKDNSDDDDDNDDDDDSDGFFNVIMWEISQEFAFVCFNLPVAWDEESPAASQYVSYNKCPYQFDENTSFRDSEIGGDAYRFQVQFAMGHQDVDDINSQEGRAAIHYKSWAARFTYKYLKELKAPYPIRNFMLMAERKSMAFDFMDMGFSAGYNLIRIDDDNYSGMALGYNLELFPFKPVSFNFNPIVTFYKDDEIVSWVTGINLHIQNYYLGLEYHVYEIMDVDFNHAQLKIGIYF